MIDRDADESGRGNSKAKVLRSDVCDEAPSCDHPGPDDKRHCSRDPRAEWGLESVPPVVRGAKRPQVEPERVEARNGDQRQLPSEGRVVRHGNRVGREEQDARNSRDREAAPSAPEQVAGDRSGRQVTRHAEEPKVEGRGAPYQGRQAQQVDRLRQRVEPEGVLHCDAQGAPFERLQPGGTDHRPARR